MRVVNVTGNAVSPIHDHDRPTSGWKFMPNETRFDATQLTRPDRRLLKYFTVLAVLTGPLFPITFAPLFFKYQTLKYRFDEGGISMSWGILFRREIHLTYRRIQDIHLTRNLIQRWMGLATVAIQTASGSAGPEMSIEGILQADQLRDELYAQMRGAKGQADHSAESAGAETPGDAVLGLLHEIRDALVSLGRPGSDT